MLPHRIGREHGLVVVLAQRLEMGLEGALAGQRSMELPTPMDEARLVAGQGMVLVVATIRVDPLPLL